MQIRARYYSLEKFEKALDGKKDAVEAREMIFIGIRFDGDPDTFSSELIDLCEVDGSITNFMYAEIVEEIETA